MEIHRKLGKTMENHDEQLYLVGGDWNHGMDDILFHSVGNFIIPTDELTPSFFEGVLVYHQAVMRWSYNLGMDQYLLIPFLMGWTSIYQLFWCELQGYKVLTHCQMGDFNHDLSMKAGESTKKQSSHGELQQDNTHLLSCVEDDSMKKGNEHIKEWLNLPKRVHYVVIKHCDLTAPCMVYFYLHLGDF